MDDLLTIATDWGPWGAAITAIAIALRTHATSSASTIRQLEVWLDDARREIHTLRGRVTRLEEDRGRLAEEVERLTPFERRAHSLAAELRELRGDVTAGGGAHHGAPERRAAATTDVVPREESDS